MPGFSLIAGLDDHFLTIARLFVGLFAEGDAFLDVFEVDLTGELRENDSVVRVPIADEGVALLRYRLVLDIQFGTVRNVIRGKNGAGIGIDNPYFLRNDR